MGCSNGKMVKVEPSGPSDSLPATKEIQGNTEEQQQVDVPSAKRAMIIASAKSTRSADSGLGDGDNDSLTSQSTTVTTRTRSGGLKRTLRALSAKSNGSVAPRQDEEDILKSLRSEGLLKSTEAHTAKSGVSFNLMDETSVSRKKIPARLAKLEKRQKRRKLLTQQDIEEKLKKAEERRKEAEAERLEKIQQVTTKSDISNALDSFAEHQKLKVDASIEKVDTATENRARQLREMRDKLRAKEAHAAKVRQRRKSIVAASMDTEKVED